MGDRQHFLVRFWGVRGSYPTPGPATLRHGGNTSCVEVQAGSHTLILDSGSGIIRLGQQLIQQTPEKPLHLALFFTHGHGDHLIGFPFFTPLFEQRARIDCFGPLLAGHSVEELVTPLMSPPYFPVDIHKLPSQRLFHTIADERQQVVWRSGSAIPELVTEADSQDVEVRVCVMFTESHPVDGAAFYRIEYAGHSLVYATDVEWKGQPDQKFLAFAHGADVLIHDAQYTTSDYKDAKHGFGHSTIEMATRVAQAAHVHELVLFHHEPTYNDDQLDQMEAEARVYFDHTRSACEGMELDLLALRTERG